MRSLYHNILTLGVGGFFLSLLETHSTSFLFIAWHQLEREPYLVVQDCKWSSCTSTLMRMHSKRTSLDDQRERSLQLLLATLFSGGQRLPCSGRDVVKLLSFPSPFALSKRSWVQTLQNFTWTCRRKWKGEARKLYRKWKRNFWYLYGTEPGSSVSVGELATIIAPRSTLLLTTCHYMVELLPAASRSSTSGLASLYYSGLK